MRIIKIRIINSTNGEDENLNRILPLAVKYGAAVIGLTMDEKGLPNTTEERIKIAEKIIKHADKYGVPREDIYIDTLTLTISSTQEQALNTLNAIPLIKEKFGCRTVLGVSNISHGLPSRESINAVFLTMAISKGLDLAIINPLKEEMTKSRLISDLISGKDDNLVEFAEKYAPKKDTSPKIAKPEKKIEIPDLLYSSILTGSRENIQKYIERALSEGMNPLDINNKYLVPAMTEVGKKFKSKEYFLPQVMMSAETMKIALKRLKAELIKQNIDTSKGIVMLSTVKGDIHDIGKNIVGAVLESQGYTIIDLGKNIDAEMLLKAIDEKSKIHIIGLSALMTTTMGEMEVVIKNLDNNNIKIPVIIGGAVITKKFANNIGAAGYAKDAVDAVALCENLII